MKETKKTEVCFRTVISGQMILTNVGKKNLEDLVENKFYDVLRSVKCINLGDIDVEITDGDEEGEEY